MTKHLAVRAVVALGLTFLLSSAAFAIADLSDWTADNNAPPDPNAEFNNYALIGSAPQTAAGGTFQARRVRTSSSVPIEKAFLSDPSLSGSTSGTDFAYGFEESFSASGTLSFTNPNNVDPNFFFGFYNSEPGTQAGIHRLGISMADSAAGAFRMQTNARDGSASLVRNLTLDGTETGTAPLSDGTYPFEFSWNVSTRVFHVSIGSGANLRFRDLTPTTTPVNTNGLTSADLLDKFGFLQFGDQVKAGGPLPADNLTFTYTVSNLNYTGDTDLPGVGLNGDFNNDNKVDAGDYATWRKNDNTNNALPNDNGLGTPIGAAHYNLWRANFGNPPGSGSLAPGAVPEPSTLVLLVVALGFARAVVLRSRT